MTAVLNKTDICFDGGDGREKAMTENGEGSDIEHMHRLHESLRLYWDGLVIVFVKVRFQMTVITDRTDQ